MNGKAKCNALKEVRKMIADSNDIEYQIQECSHQGDCLGTCPKCEAEVRYLESEIRKRQALGKKVVIAGLAAGLSVLSSCDNPRPLTNWGGDVMGDVVCTDTVCTQPSDSIIELEGDVAMPIDEDLPGDVLAPENVE